MLMVKPGMPYLDIVREVKNKVSAGQRPEGARGDESVSTDSGPFDRRTAESRS